MNPMYFTNWLQAHSLKLGKMDLQVHVIYSDILQGKSQHQPLLNNTLDIMDCLVDFNKEMLKKNMKGEYTDTVPHTCSVGFNIFISWNFYLYCISKGPTIYCIFKSPLLWHCWVCVCVCVCVWGCTMGPGLCWNKASGPSD